MTIHITIDGRLLEVEKGITILQAARQNAIDIPTLCDYQSLPSHASCRLCVVEIQGYANTPTACTMMVEAGIVIQTQTLRLQGLRSELLSMLLAEHPSCCLLCPENDACQECMVTLRKAGVTTGCRSCPKDGQCELQSLVAKIGLDGGGYPVRYRMLAVEKGDPFFDRDYNLCVLCGRCIRICNDLHFSSAITYILRGSETVVGTAFGRSLLEAGCTFCGACVQACPTGALVEKTRKWDGKPDGDVATTCPFCSIGCQMSLQVKQDQVIGSLAVSHNGQTGLCVKGRFGVPELANHPTRLLQPQKTVGATYFPITWDEAIGETVNRLAACPPGGFSLSISASSSNEDLYIAQKFTRVVMHSNAIHTPEGEALGDGLGAVVHLLKRASPLSCLETASTILCVGLDGRFSQSVIEVALHRAQRRGAKLIALYPGLNSLSDHADIWLKPGPEGEAAVLERLVNLVSLQQTHPLSAGADSGNADSGGAEPDLVEAAQTLASTLAPDFLVSPAPFIPHPRRSFILPSTPVILVGPAILASKDNRRCLAGLERLADQLSARVIVLPAQGNLVGSFLMGAYPELLPGVKAFADQAERDKIGRRWGNPIPGYFPGEGPAGIKVLFCIGASPQAGGDPPPFTIYQNILLPPAGSPADLMLPAAAFSECRGTSIDYAGQVREFQRAVAPHGESRPSWQILCTLARAMGAAGFDFGSEAEIQAEIAGLIDGFAVDRVLDLSGLATVTLAEQPDRPRPTTQQSEHLYMGFPLAVCVEGLRALYPEEAYGCGSP